MADPRMTDCRANAIQNIQSSGNGIRIVLVNCLIQIPRCFERPIKQPIKLRAAIDAAFGIGALRANNLFNRPKVRADNIAAPQCCT